MKDLIAKFREFSGAKRAFLVALTAFIATLGGDYALNVRPSAINADHHPVIIPTKGGDGKFGASGPNTEGIFVDATNHTLDVNSKKIAHLANGSASTDGAAFGQIAATTLNAFASPTASVNMGSQKLVSMADGTAASDGAVFHQIGDAVLAGKAGACDALTTSNQGTLSGTAQTIDGVALSTVGMRACLFGQTTTSQDGCYVVASGAWTRCTDLPTGTNASNRTFITVAGSANKGVWTVQVGANVVGTNDLVVVNQAAGGGGGAVSSVFGRTGAVAAQSGDYTAAQVGAYATTATLSDIATAAANIPLGGHKFTGGLDPTVDTLEFATSRYVDFAHPWLATRFGSDFSECVTSQVSTSVPFCNGHYSLISGTGTVAINTTGNTGTERGWVHLDSGATAVSNAYVISSTAGSASNTLRLSTAGHYQFSGRVRVPVLSTSAQKFKLHIGWDLDATHFVKLTLDSDADTHWILNAEDGASPQTVTTSIVPVANTWYNVLIDKAAGADSATFFVEGTSAGTISTSIPTTSNLFHECGIVSTVGTTAKTTDCDWLFSSPIAARGL